MTGAPFVASFTAKDYEQISVVFADNGIPGRPFYVTFGPVSTWLTIEELDSLQQQTSLALLAYDHEPV